MQAATTKYYPRNDYNTAQPRIFCPPKITRSLYGIFCSPSFDGHCHSLKSSSELGRSVYIILESIYRIACNFRGEKYSWFSWLGSDHEYFTYEWSDFVYLYLQVQAPTTKILPTKCLNIAEPRIFCPPKITRWHLFPNNVITVTHTIYPWSSGVTVVEWSL